MILKPTFTNGKLRNGGQCIASSRIPPTELNQIRRTKSSAETTVALLNETECSRSWRHKNALVWNECPHCQAIFVGYRKHAHKGRAAWTDASLASFVEKMTGPNNPAWKGGLTYFKRKGKYVNQSIKYVRCPLKFAAMARKDGYVMEHRLLVAAAMGRPLLRSECVHHSNHDATDNRLENLMLFASNADHKRYEHGQAIKPLWQPSRLSNTPA